MTLNNGSRRVAVTGLGAVTPVGNDALTFWDNILKGVSGIRRISWFDPTEFTSQIAGEIKEWDPSNVLPPKERKRMERFVQYAVVAATEAWGDSGLDINQVEPFRVGTILGSGIGSLGVIEAQHRVYLDKGPSRMSPFLIPSLIVNMAPGQVSISLGIKGPNSCVATACATGNHAIGDSFRLIQRGEADIMVAGGTESCITHLGVGGFCALKALSTRNDDPEGASRPFDRGRDGFVIGEGAGVVVLEEMEHAKKRGATIYAELSGYGMTGDAHHMTAPHPEGEGAIRAMQQALNDAGVNPEDVDYVNAHGTSTQLNDKVETLALKKVLGDHAYQVPISSTKSMTGHLLGAAGGIEFIASAKAVAENRVPPTINYETQDPECDLDYVANQMRECDVNVAMTNALGFGGHNATLVLQKAN